MVVVAVRRIVRLVGLRVSRGVVTRMSCRSVMRIGVTVRNLMKVMMANFLRFRCIVNPRIDLRLQRMITTVSKLQMTWMILVKRSGM